MWDLVDAACARIFRGHTAEVTCLSVCGGAGVLCSGALDGAIRVWRLQAPQNPPRTPYHALVACAEYSDCRVACCAGCGTGDATLQEGDCATVHIRPAPVQCLCAHRSDVQALPPMMHGYFVTFLALLCLSDAHFVISLVPPSSMLRLCLNQRSLPFVTRVSLKSHTCFHCRCDMWWLGAQGWRSIPQSRYIQAG